MLTPVSSGMEAYIRRIHTSGHVAIIHAAVPLQSGTAPSAHWSARANLAGAAAGLMIGQCNVKIRGAGRLAWRWGRADIPLSLCQHCGVMLPLQLVPNAAAHSPGPVLPLGRAFLWHWYAGLICR